MTARSGDPGVSPESSSAAAAAAGSGGGEIWGTSEDLLLACAVSRHGTASWDAVAKEMQSRCPSAAVFTPTTCRLRFRVLHRRFSGGVTAENEDADGGEEEEEADAAAVAGWVEELRELRVAELRREVVAIKSETAQGGEGKEHLRRDEAAAGGGGGEGGGGGCTEGITGGGPAPVEDRVSGHESGRSCKESNSSDLKRPETTPRSPTTTTGRRRRRRRRRRRPRPGDIAGEGGGVGRVGGWVEGGGLQKGDQRRAELRKPVPPPATKGRRRRQKGGSGVALRCPCPSPPPRPSRFVAFLESVRTSKAGAVFERRLDSQDGERYSGTIRRHVDLETVRSRLVGATAAAAAAACYASASEFYRDMMLLCANALVFFPRGSPEHAAALQLRALVSKQVSKDRQPHAGAKAPAAAAEEEEKKKPAKADADIAGPLLEKAPIIVCRKRDSIAKAAAAAAKGEKAEKAETDKKEKDGSEEKKKAAAAATTATAAATAKDKKARGMRTNKSRGPARNQKTAKLSETGEGTKKFDKKGGGGGGSSSAGAAAGGVAKKRNAVDFLNRMNQNGSPSTERVSLLETLKLSAAATEQQKKSSSSSSGKGDGRKEAGGSGSKKGAAASTPPGRRIGRPPKRAAAPPTPPPSKRAKDDKPTRKRGKK
ncbi:hypothetical protein OsJ_27895 [Oryza sativa Japonica Group]|uniref:Bromo domain-containing protein n=1 Tax=Oryza sativa subsp. japonica TaxID=39947 RepID=A3BUQ9_ORYSJ|nr:hypothetical protein OsJ_27895 [Oryza sativa Japonica Group]